MSLNKFTDTQKGLDLDLGIGADEIEARQILTDNIDVSTINGAPYVPGSGVSNPLTSDLKLGGFAIIEPLTAVSPALNIDQLDIAKKIDLKVGGVAKLVVKNAEVELKEDLNMNQNLIQNCSGVINPTAATGIAGTSSSIGESTTNMSQTFTSNQASIQQLGNQIIRFEPSLITSSKTLNMNSNNITNGNEITCNQINPTGTITTLTSDDIQINTGSTFNRIKSDGTLILTGGGIASSDAIVLDGTQVNITLPCNIFTTTNLFNNPINNVSSINNLTPVGGVYAGTSDGTLINNTTEQSVLPASGVGSLSIPADGFSVGDSFHCVVAGDCTFDKDDTIQIKLKENGNILAQTSVFDLEDAKAGDNAFEIEIDFTIRSIGAVGSIATNFDFTYNKDGTDSKDFRGTRAMDVQPINTTTISTLDITVQFPTNVTPSSLQTRLFRLQKVY